MKNLIIFNREPYDCTDVTWNGLRLAEKLMDEGQEVRIFLMNDSVDMARDVCKPPAEYDQDLSQMLKDLIAKGVLGDLLGAVSARVSLVGAEPVDVPVFQFSGQDHGRPGMRGIARRG